MKIAVLGLYYASNLGDAIICECVAYWLKEEFPEAEIEIIDITGSKEFSEQEYTSMRILRKRKKRLEWEYAQTKKNIKDWVYHWKIKSIQSNQEFFDELRDKEYDAAIFAGGQLFMDWLSLDVFEIQKRLISKNIPVFFNACGTGLAISKKIREELKQALRASNVKMITSRDNVQYINENYLTEGGMQAECTYDPALWVAERYQKKCDSDGVLGLGIMYSTYEKEWKISRFWIRLIKELDKREIRWKMFCNGAREDYDYGCRILRAIGKSPKQYLLDYAQSPNELITQIASFNCLISFRLHSHIIAASLDIPAIAVMWDEKLRFFYRHLGHEERCKTVEDSAKSVIDALYLAKSEGYDRALIQRQKIYARELLMNAVKTEIGNE